MGVYESYTKSRPVRDPETGLDTWTEFQHWPGYVNSRQVTATPWVEHERTTCFCCSCGDRENSDVYCRNHGFVGERRCDVHHMPGTGKGSADYLGEGQVYRVDLVKLETVQQCNARHRRDHDRAVAEGWY